MEEMHAARCGERVQSFHALSRHATVSASPYVHQPRSSPNPVLSGFYDGFIIYIGMIKSLAIGH